MSVTVRQLRAVVERLPTAEKLLVSAGEETPQTAFTLLDRLAREEGGWVGFRATTLEELAVGAAGPSMAQDGVRLCPRTVQLFLVQEVADRFLLGDGDGYFAGLPRGASLYRAILNALDDLRLAGLRAGDLDADALVAPGKARALRRLVAAWEERLEEEGWVDRAGLLRRALISVREGRARPADVLLVSADARLPALEAEILRAWPARERGLLGWDGDRGVDAGHGRATSILDGFRPVEAGYAPPHRAGLLFRGRDLPPGAAGEMELNLAVGAENEVRSVLRDVLDRGIPLDTVEVAYTDGERYRPLLYSEAERFGFRCTFAEGLPVTLTRPGQALELFHDWILEDHDDRPLRRMLRSGLVDFRRAALGLSLLPTQAARLLREAKVGRGRQRYADALERLEGRTRSRIERREADGEPAGPLRGRLERIGELGRLLHPDGGLLWRMAPRGDEVRLEEVAARSAAFLERLAARHGRLEPPAHESLGRRLEEVAREVRQTMPPRRAVRLLRDVVEQHPISRSGPQPGCLHAAPLERAGVSGRPHLFVVGLDEASFPGTGLEDPILLDRERAALPGRLPRKGRRPSDRLHDLSRALGGCDGRVTLTASVRNVAEDRELYPSSAFLQGWRVAAEDPDAGFRDCLDALSPPASFVPSTGDGRPQAAPASPDEAWLARPDRGTDGYLERVRSAHPALALGRQAERRRAGPAFTVWDGRVEAGPEALDPRRSGDVVSASQLETLVQSPFRYFLRYVLEVEPVEELSYDGRWLTALERGSLLHEAFHAFMEAVTARGERPDAGRHRELMRRTVERLLEAWRERVPPTTEGAFRREAREIRTTAGVFLRDEEDRSLRAEPAGFEVRFGRRGGRRGEGELDSPDPVRLDLGEAGVLRLRGSIDRVDRLEGGGYRVWDYKTGSPAGYSRTDPLADGHLQWLLYGRSLEVLLERAGREARVLRSGYLFPGARGHGQRMEFPVGAEGTARAARLLARRLDLVAAGLFPHATDVADCRWCDHEPACGGAELRARQAREKVESLAAADDGSAGAPEAGDGRGAASGAGAGRGMTGASVQVGPEERRLLRRWADG